jgi:hypothetical protein
MGRRGQATLFDKTVRREEDRAMPRSIRIEYPGAFYHVMARGNRRGRIFKDDHDRRFFLKTLGEACEMTGWQVHAWVLMSSAANVSQLIRRARLSKIRVELPPKLRRWVESLSKNVA